MGNSNLVYVPLIVEDVLDEIGRMRSGELSAFAMGVRFSAQMIDEGTTQELDKILKEAERSFYDAVDSERAKRTENNNAQPHHERDSYWHDLEITEEEEDADNP